MKLITNKGTIDLSEKFLIATSQFGLPYKDSKGYKVIGRDGEVIFTDGYLNKTVTVTLTHKESPSLSERQYLFSEVAPYLMAGGECVFDFAQHIKWKFNVLRGTNVSFGGTYDSIRCQIELSPCGVNAFDESELTWDSASIAWVAANMSWEGSENNFTVNNESITVENLGNVVSYPLIRLTTTGNISLTTGGKTLSVTGFSGIMYVDNEKMIVYDDSNVNQMQKTNGVFLELNPGDNTVSVTGTGTLEFINKSRWI